MLKANVGYSKLEDAFEAGVEAAKKTEASDKTKIALLFNSVGSFLFKMILLSLSFLSF